MSQTKFPVLKVRNKQPGVTTGANVEVELDGKKLENLSFLKLELHARRVAKVTMEMYVEVDAELEPDIPELTIKKVSGFQNVLGEITKRFFGKR